MLNIQFLPPLFQFLLQKLQLELKFPKTKTFLKVPPGSDFSSLLNNSKSRTWCINKNFIKIVIIDLAKKFPFKMKYSGIHKIHSFHIENKRPYPFRLYLCINKNFIKIVIIDLAKNFPFKMKYSGIHKIHSFHIENKRPYPFRLYLVCKKCYLIIHELAYA